MSGEKHLDRLIRDMRPVLNPGEYVFVSLSATQTVPREAILGEFKEPEGRTVIITRQKADSLMLSYNFVAAWITLQVHSSLEAIGLTAAFSTALAQHQISCNVVAGFYHDHLFVPHKDAHKSLDVLKALSGSKNFLP